MGHPFVLPDGVPPDRVAVIRDAFMATMRDPEFLAEAKKMRLAITPLDGEAVNKVIAEMYATPKPVVERVRAIFTPAKK
jgi:tripartite-type tricarboxylate transporter receptor subunit TctC